MSMSSNGSKGLAAEINVTPLIDVLLVMLIIFMVIQPSAPLGLGALVPQPPRNTATDPNPATIVVEITANGKGGATYAINNTPFDKAAIAPRLAEIFATRSDRQIFVKGDAALDFSTIAEVIDDAHRAGINNIGIITPRNSRSQ
jgi:biopolymer transport protein ExbD/biopolymer transport protein TolR